MPFVAGLAGGQEKWGTEAGAGEGDQPNVAAPCGVRGKDLIHNPQASLSLPFDPHNSLRSCPLSCFQMLHCVCSLIKSLHNYT